MRTNITICVAFVEFSSAAIAFDFHCELPRLLVERTSLELVTSVDETVCVSATKPSLARHCPQWLQLPPTYIICVGLICLTGLYTRAPYECRLFRAVNQAFQALFSPNYPTDFYHYIGIG